MKKRVLFLTMSLGLTVAMLAGCGKATPESLIEGMYEKEIDSATLNSTVDIEFKAENDEESYDIALTSDIELQMTGLKEDSDNKAFYSKGNIALEGIFNDPELPIESYLVIDGDDNTIYSFSEEEDAWLCVENEEDIGLPDAKAIKDIQEAFKSSIADAELAEDTEDVEGEECYVLTLDTTADNLEDLIGTLTDSLADVSDGIELDYEDYLEFVNVKITAYISKESGYCVGYEFDLADSDMQGMLDKADVTDGTFELKTCYFKFILSDIDKTEVEVPDDVIDDAIESDSLPSYNFGFTAEVGDIEYGSGVEPIEEPSEEPEEEPIEEPSEEPEEEFGNTGATTNADGSYTIYDLNDDFAFNCYAMDGYELDTNYCGDTYACFNNSNDEFTYYSVYLSVGSPTSSYILGEEIDEFYEDYDCETVDLGSICDGQYEVYWAHETYTNSDWEYDNNFVVFEYADSDGYVTVAGVDFEEMDTTDWTADDYYEAAQQIFGE